MLPKQDRVGIRGQQRSLADSSSWLRAGKGDMDGRCWEAGKGMGLQLLQPDTNQLAVPCCATGLSHRDRIQPGISAPAQTHLDFSTWWNC